MDTRDEHPVLALIELGGAHEQTQAVSEGEFNEIDPLRKYDE